MKDACYEFFQFLKFHKKNIFFKRKENKFFVTSLKIYKLANTVNHFRNIL